MQRCGTKPSGEISSEGRTASITDCSVASETCARATAHIRNASYANLAGSTVGEAELETAHFYARCVTELDIEILAKASGRKGSNRAQGSDRRTGINETRPR